MEQRTCSVCGKDKPLDRDHFRWRVKDTGGYFTAQCRECIADAKKASRARKQIKKKDALDQIEQSGVDVFLASVSRGGSNIPHSAEVVERVMQYFGGVAGFSAVLVKQYWDAQPGGSQRNKLLETMCRLVVKNVETGGAKKPLQLWSEDELEAELDRRLTEAVAEFKGVTINAEAKAIEAKEAPARIPASSSAAAGPDAIPEGGDQRTPERVAGSAGRGTAALSTESESGEDT